MKLEYHVIEYFVTIKLTGTNAQFFDINNTFNNSISSNCKKDSEITKQCIELHRLYAVCRIGILPPFRLRLFPKHKNFVAIPKLDENKIIDAMVILT